MPTDRTILRNAKVELARAAVDSNAVADASDQQTYALVGPFAATTAGSDYRWNGWTTDRQVTIKSAKIQPPAAVTANGTNYATVSLVYNDDAGGADVVIATIDTSTNSWSANQSIAMALTAANVVVPAGKAIQWKSVHAGTGVALPAGLVCQVIVQET